MRYMLQGSLIPHSSTGMCVGRSFKVGQTLNPPALVPSYKTTTKSLSKTIWGKTHLGSQFEDTVHHIGEGMVLKEWSFCAYQQSDDTGVHLLVFCLIHESDAKCSKEGQGSSYLN